MTFLMKLEISDKGRIKYELLKHQKFKKQNYGNHNLEIKFWVVFSADTSIKLHRGDL